MPFASATVSFRVAHIQFACLFEQYPSVSIVLANYQVPGNFTSVAPFPQAIPHLTRTCKSMGPSGGLPSRPRVPVLSDAFLAAARTAARAVFLFECALLRELGVELHMRVCVLCGVPHTSAAMSGVTGFSVFDRHTTSVGQGGNARPDSRESMR